MLVRGVGGKLLRGPGGKLAGSKNCCCDKCTGCCLPTGTVNGIPCQTICWPRGPRLYLDLNVTGGTSGFGNLSFTNIPMDGDSADGGFPFCPNMVAFRNTIIDGGPTFVGNFIPFAIEETLWNCADSRAALAACGNDPGEDCAWTTVFGVTCEVVDDKFTGRYKVGWSYIYDTMFAYGYSAPIVTDPLSVTKCWSRDNAVDMTFEFTKLPTAVGGFPYPSGILLCAEALAESKTFTFRIHS